MDNDLKKKLDEIFYNDTFLYRGFNKFYEMIKKKGLKIDQDVARFYYDNQEINQLFKPLNKFQGKKIVVTRPFQRVYMDTMFITSSNIILINIIDYFTKYAYVRLFRGLSVNSEKALDSLKEFIDLIGEKEIENVYTDNGAEFKSVFHQYLNDNNINHIYTDPYDKKQTSPIESLNRTVRLMFEKYISLKGNDITQINKVMEKINDAYNNSIHSSTNFTPNELLKDEKKQNIISKINNMIKTTQKDEELFKKGDFVRLPIEKGVFDKLSPNWSKEIYEIEKYDAKRNRYLVDDKYYSPYELQKIDYNHLMGTKRLKPDIARKIPEEIRNVILSFLERKKVDKIKDTEPTELRRSKRLRNERLNLKGSLLPIDLELI